MVEYEIEVSHTPSGQYFILSYAYDENESEDNIIDNIANDLNVSVRRIG